MVTPSGFCSCPACDHIMVVICCLTIAKRRFYIMFRAWQPCSEMMYAAWSQGSPAESRVVVCCRKSLDFGLQRKQLADEASDEEDDDDGDDDDDEDLVEEVHLAPAPAPGMACMLVSR